MKQELNVSIDDLGLECVLVQAWKKASRHIRLHNWYADTLELDYQSLRLPELVAEIRQAVLAGGVMPTLLDLVPAPKAFSWTLDGDSWEPSGELTGNLRPLAHVAIPDQIVATAMMLCLADRVENRQGDPRTSIKNAQGRKSVLSYGHRLFCDRLETGRLRHRWGSAKLYRQYYEDYRRFLERPSEVVRLVEQADAESGVCLAIVQSDLSKFYDRVSPELLCSKVRSLQESEQEGPLFDAFERLFNWSWSDNEWASAYASHHGIEHGFRQVALPQGLVASGFFANIILLDLDEALKAQFHRELPNQDGFILLDACRYVDDLRIVLQVPVDAEETDIQSRTSEWLQSLLQEFAPGLMTQPTKTIATVEGRETQFLVHQSRAAERIQHGISAGFDMVAGTELVGAVEGFFHTQLRYAQDAHGGKASSGLLVGKSDMRDDTAARFAAGRFRKTFRSLRPLLEGEFSETGFEDTDELNEESLGRQRSLVLSKEQLDERAKLFAAMLIEEWVRNPSSVRLLRVALDMVPDQQYLDRVLTLLRRGWGESKWPAENRQVALYCLAELFRAGATETGMVSDEDSLPAGTNLELYHDRLTSEASQILRACKLSRWSKKRFPWYLLQQVLIYLAARGRLDEMAMISKTRARHLSRYRQLYTFISEGIAHSVRDQAIFSIILRSAFGNDASLKRVADGKLDAPLLRALVGISPAVALEQWHLVDSPPSRLQLLAETLGLVATATSKEDVLLPAVASNPWNPFFDEQNLLTLALAIIDQRERLQNRIVTPWNIRCLNIETSETGFQTVSASQIQLTRTGGRAHAFFTSPDGTTDDDQMRFELGLLLRFALRGSIDFYRSRPNDRPLKGLRYRIPVSHWEQSRYGGFSGRTAFGPNWIPISSWAEKLLFELLRWPGCGGPDEPWSMTAIRERIKLQLSDLGNSRGPASHQLYLHQRAPWPGKPPLPDWKRPLRIGIVQSVLPGMETYRANINDPELKNDPGLRVKCRQHLASIMEAVTQMLRVRETHRHQNRFDKSEIDLLVLPELAVHHMDISPILVPFVRTHRCMILAGLVYHSEHSLTGNPLINSAIWLVPEWTSQVGLQVRRIEQGKKHITPPELAFSPKPSSFRPAQWIIEYEWNGAGRDPLRLSASICYDATDISLLSELRDRSDLFIVCALNKDVGTFDRMAESIHYHMYQPVLVVNNGEFGGSSCYVPLDKPYHRQVFHLHGQPQAQIAFVEIDPEKVMSRLKKDRTINHSNSYPVGNWKEVPAGLILK